MPLVHFRKITSFTLIFRDKTQVSYNDKIDYFTGSKI